MFGWVVDWGVVRAWGETCRAELVSPPPTQALNEEKAAFDRSPSKNIYLNVAVNTLKKLRGLVPSSVPGVNSECV